MTSWHRVWSGLGATGDENGERERLLARYSEPSRRYHTVQHLGECIATFQTVAAIAQRPAEVEAGLWFHDAVYELRRTDNEVRSAQLAVGILADAGVASEVSSRVAAWILATEHATAPIEPDARLLVDIDLSILGAPESRLAEYERQIRDEYSFVPEAVFHDRRRVILRAFLARPRIYYTTHFHDRLEQRARVNLSRSLNDAD